MSDSWPDSVHDLLKPEAYGLASGKVTLRTTHASWVFLTDRDVWKLKRPVDLGFLDFRDVEARRRACEEEVRLNRRLAPDVYLGVEPDPPDLPRPRARRRRPGRRLGCPHAATA